MALLQRRPKDVIHHSDQGTQHVDRIRAPLQAYGCSALDGLGG